MLLNFSLLSYFSRACRDHPARAEISRSDQTHLLLKVTRIERSTTYNWSPGLLTTYHSHTVGWDSSGNLWGMPPYSPLNRWIESSRQVTAVRFPRCGGMEPEANGETRVMRVRWNEFFRLQFILAPMRLHKMWWPRRCAAALEAYETVYWWRYRRAFYSARRSHPARAKPPRRTNDSRPVASPAVGRRTK